MAAAACGLMPWGGASILLLRCNRAQVTAKSVRKLNQSAALL
jgi:hypothetical protein